MRLVLTGTPGVGKSTLAVLLAKKLKIKLISISDFAKAHKLVSRNAEVDIKKLSKKLLPSLKNLDSYIIEGHLACEFKIPADFVFVLRCEPKTLKSRLKKRKYDKEKIDENLMSEILDYCLILCEKNYSCKIIQIDTSKRSLNSSLNLISQVIKGKKAKGDAVSYKLEKYIEGGKL